ncbi:MAG: hypothetical protein IH588_02600 [Anaerolineales bacterium]|nr:hypothetical protein [Anaerolineales bacterium]
MTKGETADWLRVDMRLGQFVRNRSRFFLFEAFWLRKSPKFHSRNLRDSTALFDEWNAKRIPYRLSGNSMDGIDDELMKGE